ncbi:MAG TPA: glucoamylase family protein [Thermoanaerobaculia bacterium]|nr:glucoamylase family protein [Thermoanaerobaculia bacterium]
MKTAPFTEEDLHRLQKRTFGYFLHETDPSTGLVRDSTHVGSPASIAAVGLALACYPVAAERGFMERSEAAARTMTTLRFFLDSPQGEDPDAAGHRGFYYHFLHVHSGRRAWRCELSTMDTAILIAGALAAAAYFRGRDREEREIREIADRLYRRVEWPWAANGARTLTHGWKPEEGFLRYRWRGYSEALLLYLLALGSPTHPLPKESWTALTAGYRWRSLYGEDFLYAGPLFVHQFSHVWVDFRGIRDAYMRSKDCDYFENSRRATYAHQRYAIRNPKRFRGYGELCWGITASEGPGPAVLVVDGIERRFLDYAARSIPRGPDDGTLAPWAVVASLPFAPEIVLPSIRYIEKLGIGEASPYGFEATFNPTFPSDSGKPCGWVSPRNFGLNDGPAILMIENYRSGLLWKLMSRCPYLVAGLKRAGFRGGWLDRTSSRRTA